MGGALRLARALGLEPGMGSRSSLGARSAERVVTAESRRQAAFAIVSGVTSSAGPPPALGQ